MNTDGKTPVVVISHGSGTNALSIVRSLGRKGIKVHVVALRGGRNLSASSRFTYEVHWIDAETTECLSQSLQGILEKQAVRPLLLCDSDESYHLAHACGEWLSEHFIITCPLHRFPELQDKEFQTNAASRAGIPVPKSWYPADWSELATIVPSPGRRLIVKPNPSKFVESAPFKILHAENAEEVDRILRKHVSTPAGMIIQEFIEGDDAQMWVVSGYRAPEADALAMVTISKVKQSGVGAGGVGIICRTTDTPILKSATDRLVKTLNYYGAFGIEFKYCAAQREFVFIEANYRTARIHVIGRRTGGDLPVVIYESATEQTLSSGTECVMGDGVWYYDMRGCWNTLPRTGDFGIACAMAGHMLLAPFRNTEWAVHAWDDPKPTVAAWLVTIRELASKVTRKGRRLFGSIIK